MVHDKTIKKTKYVTPAELAEIQAKNKNAKNSAAAAQAEMEAKRVEKLKSVAELTIPKLNAIVETLNSLSTKSVDEVIRAGSNISNVSREGELHLKEIQRVTDIIRFGENYSRSRSFLQGGGKRLTKKRKTHRR